MGTESKRQGMPWQRMTTIKNTALGVVALVLSGGCTAAVDGTDSGEEEQLGEVTSALNTTQAQSLVITMTSVTRNSTRTEDPCSTTPGDEDKVWTIGHMLKREAEKNGIAPSTYVTNWMNAWTGTVTINGETVPALNGPNVSANWQRFAGGSTSLPLHKAPFWLLAIVNRPDLRKHRPLGEPLGGEVRFVFGLLAADQNSPPCPTVGSDATSTVILEYSANKANENEVRDFARRWLDLSNVTGATYRSALAALTEEVINSGRLLRIRTNDGPVAGKVGGTQSGWDFSEFEPHPTTKFLQRSTIKQTPGQNHRSGTSQRMSDWIWPNRAALYANAFDDEIVRVGSRTSTQLPIASYSVPNTFPGTTTWFRGALDSLGGQLWNGPTPTGMPADQLSEWQDARFRFAVGTCSGCHGPETGTSFLHIFPDGPGVESRLSSFLSGSVTVPDPVTGRNRGFSEMFRREMDLRKLVDGAPVLVPVFGNNYTVRFHSTGKCLDSANNTNNDGDASQLYTCSGNGNQRLSLVATSTTNVYNLKYKHSGKCIDVQNASTSSGARVVQMTCNSARASQKLTLSVLSGAPLGTPSPRLLKFQHSNLCLLVQNAATADTTAIVQGTCPASNDFAKGFNLVE